MTLKKIIKTIAEPLFEEGADKLYVAVGCQRVYVARQKSTECKRCGSNHTNLLINNLSDVDNLNLDLDPA